MHDRSISHRNLSKYRHRPLPLLVIEHLMRHSIVTAHQIPVCLCRQVRGGAQTRSDVSEQMAAIGGLDNLSLSDVPRDRLKRSANSLLHKPSQK